MGRRSATDKRGAGSYRRLLLAAAGTALVLVLPAQRAVALWTAPAALNANAAADSGDDYYPQVATDGSGNLVAVWTSWEDVDGVIGSDWDILVSRSTDNGATWTGPVPLNTNAATDSDDDYNPQVTTDSAGAWVAVWDSNENLGGTIGPDRDIVVSRSTDNGATWTTPVALDSNAATDSADDEYPQVTTDGVGNWVVVWHSYDTLAGTIGMDVDLLVSRSTDNGATWTVPMLLNTNAATDSGSDYHPQVTTDGATDWIAAWGSNENLAGTVGTDADILASRSTDSGASWTAPTALSTDAVTDSGDDSWPHVITDGAANWVAVWESDDTLGDTIGPDWDILVSRSTDNGVTWLPPAAINSNAAIDSGDDSRPQVMTDGAGNWVAVWESMNDLGGTIGPDRDILVSRSTDNGATWTAPAAMNSNAATDSGDDSRPQVVADGAGKWVAVWHSRDDLGGTIGTDFDILVCRSEFSWNEDADGDGTINIDDDDIDGDGISNDDEGNADPDGDTIPNYLDTDSDGNGLSDGWELDNGFDPYGDDETENDDDSDDDGLPDGWEVDGGLDPNDGTGENGADGDPDGDGLDNLDEYSGGTDPGVSDVPVVGVFASILLALAVCVIGLSGRRKKTAGYGT